MGDAVQQTIAEEAETYAVKERGRLVRLTRQAIINDDTRALEQVLRSAALAGAQRYALRHWLMCPL
jgi:hypothetical protein